jgi:hypothetical protein
MRAVILRSFWVEWTSPTPERLPLGCAVTAWDLDDALEQIRSVYCPTASEVSQPTLVEEDITVEGVATRVGWVDIGVPLLRGIWYPHLDNP